MFKFSIEASIQDLKEEERGEVGKVGIPGNTNRIKQLWNYRYKNHLGINPLSVK